MCFSGRTESAITLYADGEAAKNAVIRGCCGSDGVNLLEVASGWYDPDTGRFTSLDPVRDGANWYAYCGNNPIGYIDPSGGFRIVSRKEATDFIKEHGIQVDVEINDIARLVDFETEKKHDEELDAELASENEGQIRSISDLVKSALKLAEKTGKDALTELTITLFEKFRNDLREGKPLRDAFISWYAYELGPIAVDAWEYIADSGIMALAAPAGEMNPAIFDEANAVIQQIRPYFHQAKDVLPPAVDAIGRVANEAVTNALIEGSYIAEYFVLGLINRGGSSKALREDLEAIGERALRGDQAHHMVPMSMSPLSGPAGVLATLSRGILVKNQIGIDNAVNGVFVNEKYHPKLHKNIEYQKSLFISLYQADRAGNTAAIEKVLRNRRVAIKAKAF